VLKDDGPPKELARDKATRKWRNRDIEKRLKEQRAKTEAPLPKPKELEVGDVIENDRVVAEAVTQFQTKFANEIRSMLEGHTKRNILLYKLSLRYRIKRLKYEKLKRLEAKVAQRNQEASNV
jgi:hypothetical protein